MPLALVFLVLFNSFEPDVLAIPQPLPLLFVLGVAIGVALGAAVLSAWPASKEKPLNVVRYE